MTEAVRAQPEVRIGRYWDVLVSRWTVVLAAAGLGLFIAGLYVFIVPSTYSATTTLAVFPISTDPYAANRNSNNLIDMSAEAVTASSFKVAELAAEATGNAWDVTELRNSTTVSTGSDSTTMTIVTTARSEERAREGAAAMAEAYLQSRSDQAAVSIDSVVERDRARIDEHRQELTSAIERLAVAPQGSPDAAEASSDQQIINLQISALLSRISSLEGIDTTGGVILNPASLTTVVVKPARLTTLLTGLAAGVVVGVVAAFVTHSRRKTVNTVQDLSRELEVETLGFVKPDPEAAALMIGTIAQRLLRLAALEDARVVALFFEEDAPWPSTLADDLVAAMYASGTPARVSDAASFGSAPGDELVLIPIAPDASQALRLHSLRISDLTVLVVGAGVTTIRNTASLITDADEMGSRVVGAVMLLGGALPMALDEAPPVKQRSSARSKARLSSS